MVRRFFNAASSLRSSQRQGQEMVVVATANKVKREAIHIVGNIEKKWIASSLRSSQRQGLLWQGALYTF
jgi:hypothetical protein